MCYHRSGRRNGIRAIILGIFFLPVITGAGTILGGLFAAETQEHRTAELACQEPPHCEETGEVIGDPTPFYKDYFGEKEEVWVAVDTKIIGQISQAKIARIYIVYNKSEDQWNKNPKLKDISGDKSGEDYEEITFQPGDSKKIFIQAWKKPIVCAEGYDVVVDFEPFGEYNKGVDIIDGLRENGLIVPNFWICLESITFNHDPHSDLSDAMNIRKNFNEEVHVPEWKKGEVPYSVAYIKDRGINVKAVFTASPNVRSAEIKALGVNGLLGNILTKTIEFNGCISEPISFNISCPTPDKITSFIQKWKWYYQNVNESNYPKEYYMGSSRNKIFIVLATPQSPWTTSGQAEPWSEVLEKSCRWANGEIAPTAAAKKIAYALYEDIGGYYNGSSQYTSPGESDFDLVRFMGNIQKIGNVNCNDMSKALVIFSNAVGCGLTYRYCESFGEVKCIKPIGSHYCETKFIYHAFASMGDKMFDASLKVYKNCDPSDESELLTNILWTEYIKKIAKTNSFTHPDIYSFKINHKIKRKEIENVCKKRFEWEKAGFNFYRPHMKDVKAVFGADISKITVPQLKYMKNVWKKNLVSIEEIQNDIYSIIHKFWAYKNDQFDLMMVVSPTSKSAIKYLALQYAGTSTKLPLRQLESNIGNVCFITHAEQQNECFSGINFIRRNILIMMKAEGTIEKDISGIALELDKLLLEMIRKTEEKSWQRKNILNITCFCLEKDKIKVGEKDPLHLVVENPMGGKLEYIWKISGGGIEYDCHENIFYYGSEKGKQTITVTVINENGLKKKSKTLEIEIQ